ncbi:MAG: hypothetical protein ABIY40_02830 [Rhodanobacteraceae bacterium]|nr:hypothetical protein [Pseudomonadota bacterium]
MAGSIKPVDALFRIRYEDRGDYLCAEVDGPEDNFDVCVACWKSLATECERRGTRQLLVIDRLQGDPLPPDEMDRLVGILLGTFLKHVRIAFHEPVSAHLPLVEHAELSAREAGFTARVFADEHEAVLWLRYGVDEAVDP